MDSHGGVAPVPTTAEPDSEESTEPAEHFQAEEDTGDAAEYSYLTTYQTQTTHVTTTAIPTQTPTTKTASSATSLTTATPKTTVKTQTLPKLQTLPIPTQITTTLTETTAYH